MLNSISSYKFLVNQFQIKADYYSEDIEKIFVPLIKKLKDIQNEKQRRIIVYMAAPPGVGKSTLSLFLEYLAKNDNLAKIQSIGMDGFHYPQDYIKNNTVRINNEEVPMSKVKGCPETFDLEKLKSKLHTLRDKDTKWPIYDRQIHDVVEDKISVTEDIVIIEGNWLLLNEDKWSSLNEYCDYSIFIKSDESMLKDRLIDRKIKGGLSEEEAKKFFENSDRKNIHRALSNRLSADLELELLNNGKYIKKGN